MRKFLLATSAAALALAFSGQAHAELAKIPAAPATVGAARDHDHRWSGVLQGRRSGQADRPGWPNTAAASQPEAKPAEQAAQPMVTETLTAQTLSAEDTAVADRLRKSCRKQAVCSSLRKEQDRAGVLAFYRNRNFAPLWIADGKAAPRAQQAMDFLHGVEADGLDPADYPDAGIRRRRPCQARRERADADQFGRHFRASCQHRSGRLQPGQCRGLVRAEGARSGRRHRQARLRAAMCARRWIGQPAGAAIQGAQGGARRRPRRPEHRRPSPRRSRPRRAKSKKGPSKRTRKRKAPPS